MIPLLTRCTEAQIFAPSELEAQAEDSSYIKIKWADNSTNEDGFYLQRTSSVNDTGSWETIGETGQNVRIFYDYWAVRGIMYYYRAFAYMGPIHSGYSNIDSAMLLGNPNVLPAAPSNLSVQNVTMNSITIHWKDNANNELGFVIARRAENEQYFRYIDTVQTDILTYQEVGLTPDFTYFYKVCAYNNFGISDYSNTVSARTDENNIIFHYQTGIPENYFLGNNYPNPFNPVTSIEFGIRKSGHAELKVFNSLGKEIETLASQNFTPGNYRLIWNAGNLPSGVYFYSLIAEDFREFKKMILTK